jgi:hypothetical protein
MEGFFQKIISVLNTCEIPIEDAVQNRRMINNIDHTTGFEAGFVVLKELHRELNLNTFNLFES